MTPFHILYRGSLSSCNYSCAYCPFAKTSNTRDELHQDAQEVARFVAWVENAERPIGILFTPWGEAIVHSYYRQALIRLSHVPHVQRVSIQTNLSCRLNDFSHANREKLALWATFHPTQISLTRFLNRCHELERLQLRYSVGVVGLREHFPQIEKLRQQLPPQVYVWINSYKRQPDYYRAEDTEFLRRIDPYFDLNCHYYPSHGKPCRAGQTAFTVDGDGNVRRCHFVDTRLGNIYREDIFTLLVPRDCPNATCGCHIGYVHQPDLRLDALFGDNVLERIPSSWPAIDPAFTSH